MCVKKLKVAVALLGILALLLTGSLFFLLRASLPFENGTIRLSGLTSDASVNTDALGIPSIQAANRTDAFRILGFLHARDRLFQMDLMRRKSAGRLAEIFGAKAVNLDKSQRDYQFEQAAENIFSTLPTSQKSVLIAYVAGVNAFISQVKILPPEFIALNYRPEAWREEDSLLVELGMFQTLNGHEQDERMTSVMAAALPEPLLKFLTPDTDIYATPLIGGPESRRPVPPVPVNEFSSLASRDVKLARGGVDAENIIAGSNNWVVAGGKTADGRAIVANDMHLGLNTPNIWYRAELRYMDRYLNGVTLPGLPLQIVGGNRDVAWGFTNATVDLLDLISLEINPLNNEEYLTPQGWRGFGKKSELIKVKDGQDIRLEVRSTLWGPVSSQPLLGRPVAIKWTALENGAVDIGLLDMDRASSTQEAMQIVNEAGGPPQNVVFADRAGHIGWTYMGRFPKRKGFDGLISKSWADAAIGWDGFINSVELPRLYDPPEGFIVTANNRTLGSGYPYVLGYDWSLGYRAYRISELLRSAHGANERDLLKIQLDTRCEVLNFYQRLALEALENTASEKSLPAGLEQSLRAWDGYMNNDSRGAALLIEFRTKLAEAVFAKVVGRCRQFDPNFNYAWREMETPLRELLTQRPAGVLPGQYNGNWQAVIMESLTAAAENLTRLYPGVDLAELQWGDVNRITLQHPFSKNFPILAGFLNINEFDSSGCAGFCVKAMSKSHGASERLVLSPLHPEDGILEMPGGQSGHPLSRHYRDQQGAWESGEIAAFEPSAVENVLHFQP